MLQTTPTGNFSLPQSRDCLCMLYTVQNCSLLDISGEEIFTHLFGMYAVMKFLKLTASPLSKWEWEWLEGLWLDALGFPFWKIVNRLFYEISVTFVCLRGITV